MLSIRFCSQHSTKSKHVSYIFLLTICLSGGVQIRCTNAISLFSSANNATSRDWWRESPGPVHCNLPRSLTECPATSVLITFAYPTLQSNFVCRTLCTAEWLASKNSVQNIQLYNVNCETITEVTNVCKS
jgi:hypothetical protein